MQKNMVLLLTALVVVLSAGFLLTRYMPSVKEKDLPELTPTAPADLQSMIKNIDNRAEKKTVIAPTDFFPANNDSKDKILIEMLNEGSFEETYDKKLDDFFERQKVSSLVYTDKKIVNYADVDEAALGQQYMASSDPNIAFQQSQANIAVISSTATTNEDLRFKIFQGKRFSAVLTHAISSELPGMIVAEIVRPVYGFQDKVILLPVGTRIIGQYSAASGSGTPVGASRIFTVWNRAIRPDGIEISLGATGSDRLGMAGQSGFVDNHFFEIFGVSSLVSILGAGASTVDSNQNYANPYTTGVVNSAAETSSSILENRINIKPTIYIDQGEAIEIVANNDLDFTQALSKYYDKQVVVQ